MKLVKLEVHPDNSIILQLAELNQVELEKIVKFAMQMPEPAVDETRKKYKLTEEQREKYRENARLARKAKRKKAEAITSTETPPTTEIRGTPVENEDDVDRMRRMAEQHEARKKRAEGLKDLEAEALHEIEVLNAEEAMQRKEMLGTRDIENIDQEEAEDEAE